MSRFVNILYEHFSKNMNEAIKTLIYRNSPINILFFRGFVLLHQKKSGGNRKIGC